MQMCRTICAGAQPIGHWRATADDAAAALDTGATNLCRLNQSVTVLHADDGPLYQAGGVFTGGQDPEAEQHPAVAFLPMCPPAALGDPGFRRDYGLDYAYLGGSMANGISSVNFVEALGRAGMLGFFGSCLQVFPDAFKMVGAPAVGPARRPAGAL